MQISAINNNQTKPNFNAYMRVYERGSAKKLLSEEAIKALSEKLEPIGKKTDSLVVYLTQQLSEEDAIKANIENDENAPPVIIFTVFNIGFSCEYSLIF